MILNLGTHLNTQSYNSLGSDMIFNTKNDMTLATLQTGRNAELNGSTEFRPATDRVQGGFNLKLNGLNKGINGQIDEI